MSAIIGVRLTGAEWERFNNFRSDRGLATSSDALRLALHAVGVLEAEPPKRKRRQRVKPSQPRAPRLTRKEIAETTPEQRADMVRAFFAARDASSVRMSPERYAREVVGVSGQKFREWVAQYGA